MESGEISDGELLGRYVRDQSDDAFAELVGRHLNLVYSAALRQVDGDAHTAEDIAQRVFTELARQARSLQEHPTLAGWLHTTTRQIAGHHRRSGQRRARREQEAYAMQEQTPTSETDEWRQLRPVLDEAMQELPESDRLALLLRFFEGQELRRVGEVLGLTENAARMRVQRALEKLQQILTRKRIGITAAGLATVLTAHTVTAAPASLFASLAASSVAGAGAVGSGLGGFAATKSTILAMKIPLSYASILLLASAPLVIQQFQIQKTRAELAGLQREPAPLEQGGTRNTGGNGSLLADEWARLKRGEAELASLREEAGRIQASFAGARGAEWANAEAQLKQAEAARQEATAETEAVELREKTVNSMKHIGMAARIFSNDNGERPPKTFEEMKEILGPLFAEAEALERYEFYPQPRPISEAEPQLFMFREKEPRQLPNGKWERSYTLSDGSVQNAVSDTPDFSAWEEHAHGIASPDIPEALRGNPAYAPKP
jgi:RNA polymerase sigma factor (sigma-70 family)